MVDFSKQIKLFKSLGTFNYKFDGYDNLIIDSSSACFEKNYVSIPLGTMEYKNDKILHFSDVGFSEFIPVTKAAISSSTQTVEDLSSQLSSSLADNSILIGQLNDVVKSSNNNSNSANNLAIKQVIIGLRVSLGQGNSVDDFSNTFPYSALVPAQLNKI